jgi:molybdopterin synthase catalytic subunit
MATPETLAPPDGATSDWCALTEEPLTLGVFADWAVLPGCGAIVAFSGTVRDHADGRSGVSMLEYEAYEEQVAPKLAEIAAEARRRWPTLGRFVLVHRVGPMAVGESSVVVVASSPHRPEAFEAARFGIDTLKATVPIWKKEHWADGADWGLHATPVERVPQHAAPTPVGATADAERIEGGV